MTHLPDPPPLSTASEALGTVIASLSRRLDSLPHDDPAAPVLREQLTEIAVLRDKVDAKAHDRAQRAERFGLRLGYAGVAGGAAATGYGAYALATQRGWALWYVVMGALLATQATINTVQARRRRRPHEAQAGPANS
jgi:hypothetical protein